MLPSLPSAAQRCPPELLSIIFHHISTSSSGSNLAFSLSPSVPHSQQHGIEHTRALVPLTSVCRTWHESAVEVLYRDLPVCIAGQLPALVANCKRLLGFVKHLQILWDRQPWVLPQDPDLALIPVLLDLSPNIAYVTLAGEQFDLSSPQLLSAFHRRSLPSSLLAPILGLSCSSLTTAYTSQRFGPQGRRTSSVLHSLLRSLPHLLEGRFDEFRAAFSGGHAAFNSSLNTITSDQPYLPKLKKLAMTKVVLESLNLETLLCPLKDSLEELLLDRTSLTTCEKWKMILGSIGKKLRVLELRDCDFWATWEDLTPDSTPLIDSIVSFCPNLTTLTLIGSLDSRQPSLDHPHPTLDTLTIGSRYISHARLTTALSERRYGGLKSLVVEHGCEWSETERNEVRDTCALEEVAVKCSGPGLYVSWPRVDTN